MADGEVILTEEVSAKRRVIRKEGGQTTGSCNTHEVSILIQPGARSRSCSSTEDEWLCSLVNGGISENAAPEKPKMQRVPRMFRDVESNKKCYEPLVVSIGPLHHGKPELEHMEKFKLPLARQYAKECKGCITKLYEKVAEVASEARNYYTEDSTEGFDDEAFAHMMFLDGCFILQFICCIVNGTYEQMNMKSHDIAFVRRDIFLLENQLPLKVLKVLMSSRFKKDEGEQMINSFIKRSKPEPSQTEEMRNKFRHGHPKLKEEKLEFQGLHLLEFVRAQLIDVKAFPKEGCHLTGEWCSYRSVMELRTVGIHFRCSKSHRFSDITYQPMGFASQLTLPSITIDDSTKSLLLNLVAFEACPDTPDDFGVTSYVCFMDSLIDHSEDVKELRSKGILLNFLGSDQQVADLFNEIAMDLVPNPHGFIQVKREIENHYKNNINIWIAEWKHTHFSSPWTIIAFIAAIFAISLSVIQTVLGVIQTNLAAHPPSN